MITADNFTFPIVMVDGENEERKEREKDSYSNLIPGQDSPEVEYDIVYGQAKYPYYHYLGAEDRWLPTSRSLRRALNKKFDACIVRFENIGQFLVPWTKEKFDEEIEKFALEREKLEEPEIPEIEVSAQQLLNILKIANEKRQE